jgi:hypothetical protein
MKNLPIEGGTEGVGASQGWQGISILYNTVTGPNGTWPNMTTHWQLTREEMAMLLLGGKLEVSILGEPGTWPPIMLGVSTERIEIGMDRDDAAFLEALADNLEHGWQPEKGYATRLRRIARLL